MCRHVTDTLGATYFYLNPAPPAILLQKFARCGGAKAHKHTVLRLIVSWPGEREWTGGVRGENVFRWNTNKQCWVVLGWRGHARWYCLHCRLEAVSPTFVLHLFDSVIFRSVRRFLLNPATHCCRDSSGNVGRKLTTLFAFEKWRCEVFRWNTKQPIRVRSPRSPHNSCPPAIACC